MPQDGSMNYQYPPGTPGIPDTTIESESYNTFLDDLVVNDLNIARPIHRGGTGGSTADQALANLSAEKATQIVTNYDAHLFFPGSFRSSTVTGQAAPVDGHAFAGVAYLNEPFVNPPTNQNLIIEARDQSDTNVPGFLYIREKKAGVWSAWKQSAESVAVRYDIPQSLTETQQTQARSNIYAAPYDALAYNGMQINGSMDVSQEYGTTQISVPNLAVTYVLDGMQVQRNHATATVFSAQGTGTTPWGFGNSVYLSVVTPMASIAAGDFARFYMPIEGWRVARLGWGTASAQPITIGFWVNVASTGTMTVAIINGANNRTYRSDVSLAAGWQYKTVTIPGDTTGTWEKTNLAGMYVAFTFACGATYQGPNNAWAATNTFGTSSTSNFFTTTSTTVYLTHVIVLPGTQAPSAAQSPLIMRPYDQELVTCQRYWEKSQHYTQLIFEGSINVGNNYTAAATFKVTKRAAPTIALLSITGDGLGAVTTAFSSIDHVAVNALANYTQSYGYYYAQWTANARL